MRERDREIREREKQATEMHLRRRILLSAGSNGPRLSSPPPLSPSRQIPSHVIIAVASAGAAAVFLALVYYAVLRHRLRRPHLSPFLAAAGDAEAAANDSGHHPFWQVKTVGLDDAAIESIGSYAHRPGDRAAGDNSCSVCLGEVVDGEIVRLLPKCGHVFHVNCIDTWLRCHVNCPLCRAAVGVAAVPADDAADGANSVEVDPSDEEEVGARVSVETSPESCEGAEAAPSRALRSVSMDQAVIRVDDEKEGNSSNGSNCSKDEGFEKGQSESGMGFLFSRMGRARSSSVLPL